MGTGDKPAIRILAVSKADKTKKRSIAAAWVSDDGERLNGMWDKDIVAVKFSDGTVATRDKHWINVYDNRGEQPSRRTKSSTFEPPPDNGDPPPDFGDDEIPF
jgi:hypothetical protein